MTDRSPGSPWQDTRGTVTATRLHAHSDDAKQRTDDHSTVRPRGRGRLLLAGVAGALLIGGGGAVALAAGGGDDPAPERTRTEASDPTPGSDADVSPGADTSPRPLAGRVPVVGTWSAENEVGQSFEGPATLVVRCDGDCRVTVARDGGAGSERLVVLERSYAPAGGGSWVAPIDEPLKQTLPGCDALRAKGSSTLTWDGEQVSIEASIAHDELKTANRCVLIASTISFSGTPRS